MQPPLAPRHPQPQRKHGDVRTDDYYWLNQKDNDEVLRYLEAENAYYDEVMQPLNQLSENLYEEFIARIPDEEQAIPVRFGSYFYSRRQAKDWQYPVYFRQKANHRADLAHSTPEVLLDLNVLAKPGEYLSVTERRISPNQQYLAYLENRDGTDRYTLRVRDLASGEWLSDEVPNVFISDSIEWDASGQYLFYISVDESQRPYQLWRHKLGDKEDILIYEEADMTCVISLSQSRDGQYLFLQSSSKTTSETRYLHTHQPTENWTLFQAKRPNIEYTLEHWQGDFLVLTNENATNFRLQKCPTTNRQPLEDVFPYDETRYLTNVYPFADALVLEGRDNGLTQVWIYAQGELHRLEWSETVYTVRVLEQYEFQTHELLLQYESFLTPKTTYAVHLQQLTKEALLVQEIPGKFDPTLYTQQREYAYSEDGTKIPISLVYRKDALHKGPAPLLLNGYGSYGICFDPVFQAQNLPLLDRGLIIAIAHVRGGGEMGRSWYESGKLQQKMNTFTDFIDCAKHLIKKGYTSPEILAARGGSAGGLLMGTVANMAGELFAVIEADVPFVDVVTTMLDPTIPLTTLEYDEWGNPENETDYHYMKSYSPYDNVKAKDYPHLLVTTGLNDPRVGYWEPAKWVAKLRVMKTDEHMIVMRIHMGAGHFGSSGRLEMWKERATQMAFLLDKIGIHA